MPQCDTTAAEALDWEAPEALARSSRTGSSALQILSPAVLHPDQARPLALYGSAWAEGDRLPVPEADFPAGASALDPRK
jgi:hypothetical protein